MTIDGLTFSNDQKVLEHFDIPSTLRDISDEQLISYLRDRYQNGEIVHRCRLSLVGEGGAGKTTLVRRWKDNTYEANRSMTDGVEITELSEKEVNFNIFDFGGQK